MLEVYVKNTQVYDYSGKELFHIHTHRCKHASSEADVEYVEKAIELGARKIVFTDHAPFPDNPFGNRMDIEELPEYIDSLAELKNTYKKKIEEDIRKRANEKNLNITSLNVYIETEDENRYGMLNSLVMKVEKNETSKKNNDVNQIKEINISKNVQNNEIIENKDKTATEKEINEFKEYINATYYLEKEKIHINE